MMFHFLSLFAFSIVSLCNLLRLAVIEFMMFQFFVFVCFSIVSLYNLFSLVLVVEFTGLMVCNFEILCCIFCVAAQHHCKQIRSTGASHSFHNIDIEQLSVRIFARI